MGHVLRGKAESPVMRDVPPPAAAPGGQWRQYLHDVCELLWPPPAVITLDEGPARPQPTREDLSPPPATRDAVISEFLLIPGARRPPLVVPAQPRLAAAAVRHYRAPRSRRARMASKALAAGLAGGLGRSLVRGRIRISQPPAADTIESYLRAAISPDIRVSMYLGPARANRKPVLQLLSPAGEPVGYAKIGINPLTRHLVRTEHDALLRLAQTELAEIRVPQVLHFEQWRGFDVLVLNVLPVWLRDAPCSMRLAAAMLEVSQVDGLRTGPLADSAYLSRLRDRLADADEDPQRAALFQALDTLTARAGGEALTFGAWHGDWAPWNMSNTRDGLLVWDWERFSSDVPAGFDALHRWVQAEVGPGRREPLAVAAQCPERAAELIAPFGVGGRPARLTAILYLAELATRYLVDRQAQAGARLGTPGAWLIPAIIDEIAQL
jgi:hypothetical protein